MKRLITFSLITGFFLSSFAPGKSQIQQAQLENGLQVLVLPDTSTNKAYGVLLVHAGSKHDPSDNTGLAHYLEHMLFKGNQKIGSLDWKQEQPLLDSIEGLYEQLGTLSETGDNQRGTILTTINQLSQEAAAFSDDMEYPNLITQLGGDYVNAMTGADFTAYFSSFAKSQIYKWLHLYATAFETPSFRGFQSELEVVYEERNRYADNLVGVLLDKVLQNIFPNHPYGKQSTIGTVEHLKSPSIRAAKAFFRNYYVPNNMTLALSGDFDLDKLLPALNASFGRMKSASVPQTNLAPVKPFKGAEYRNIDLSWWSFLQVGVLTYRTVPPKHPDFRKLELVQALLTNEFQTGLLDELVSEGKLLVAMSIQAPLKEHGLLGCGFVPHWSLFSSNFDEASQNVLQKLSDLKAGNFSDTLFQQVKQSLIKANALQQETAQSKLWAVMSQVALGQQVQTHQMYKHQLEQLTKGEVLEVARRYISEDYMLQELEIGFPLETGAKKIEKPNLSPIKAANEGVRSAFSRSLDTVAEASQNLKKVDFERDVENSVIRDGLELSTVPNAQNDYFSLKLVMQADRADQQKLQVLAPLMQYAYTEKLSLSEKNKRLAELNLSLSFKQVGANFVVEAVAPESSFEQCVDLLVSLLQSPQVSEASRQLFYQQLNTSREVEENTPAGVQAMLEEYVLYGSESRYLKRWSMDEVADFELSLLGDVMRSNISRTPGHVFYVGKKQTNEVRKTLQSLPLYPLFKKKSDRVRIPKHWESSHIFLVNKPGMLQTKLFVRTDSIPYDPNQSVVAQVFNYYFGGYFGSLLFRDIRKDKSLAYEVHSRLSTPMEVSGVRHLTVQLGTQRDKMPEALESLLPYFEKLPLRPSYLENIKQTLTNAWATQLPSMRQLPEYVYRKRAQGYVKNPIQTQLNELQQLGIKEIESFYNQYIKKSHLNLGVVGDIDYIDVNQFPSSYIFQELSIDELRTE